jgi:hypothetical protein
MHRFLWKSAFSNGRVNIPKGWLPFIDAQRFVPNFFDASYLLGLLKPRAEEPGPDSTATAAAATVGAVLVIGPGDAAAAGPGYALRLAVSDSRCTPGRRR